MRESPRLQRLPARPHSGETPHDFLRLFIDAIDVIINVFFISSSITTMQSLCYCGSNDHFCVSLMNKDE